MRFVIGVGLALSIFGAGGAIAADAGTVKAPIKVASAEGATRAPQSVTVPVTKTALAAPKRVQAVAPSLIARIDLNRQRMQVTSNGQVVGSWKISSGKRGHETPPGRFRPQWSSKMHYSRKYNNSPMPYSVFFNGGIATHGTGYTSRLGGAASHGCIRLHTSNARKFYQLVHRHGYKRTRIIVTGRANITRTASRGSVRRNKRIARYNSFAASTARRNAYAYRNAQARRYAERRRSARRQQRARRTYQASRMVYPGDSR